MIVARPAIAETVSTYVAGSRRADLLDLLAANESLDRLNSTLHRLSGIRQFFLDALSVEEFRQSLLTPDPTPPRAAERQWGDFQTPMELAVRICTYLRDQGVSPRVVVEPTCGAGHFVLAALLVFPTVEFVYGVEIQEKYLWQLKLALLEQSWSGGRSNAEVELRQDDIFVHRFPPRVLDSQDILILGNPPWVTNAEVGALHGDNLPAKRNLKALSGLDAITGKSNFDLGEFVLLRVLDLFAERRGTLALLCKTAVIKNLVMALLQRPYPLANLTALEIDAPREFGAAVSAALFAATMGAARREVTCRVAALAQPKCVVRSFGWVGDKFVASVEDYAASAPLDGQSPEIWRQGIKHDCARAMELDVHSEGCINGLDEAVQVEDEFVYWLLKSSDLRHFEVSDLRKKVIVTQRRIGEDTAELQVRAPRLWQYLNRHADLFDCRKSSIYRGKPRFAMFGIGDYSFKTYKVAISGLYKEPCFCLVSPIGDRPVMLDDTCYFLGFDGYLDALFTATLLNGPLIRRLLRSIVFLDAKRPYTKEILMRVDVALAAAQTPWEALCASWGNLGYVPAATITAADYESYRRRFSATGNQSGGRQLGLGL